ncbi:CHAD domain-containing protein [Candidatus Nitrospira salsa]
MCLSTCKHHPEQDVRLGAPAGFCLPEHLTHHVLHKRVFTSTYYDTQNYDLTRLGITLRRRVEQGKGSWQLKIPKSGASGMLEISHGSPKLPPELADLLFAFLRGQAPTAIAKLRTERHTYQIREDDRTLAELTKDHIALLEDRRIRKRLTELRVMLIDGTNKHLKHITTQLKTAGAVTKNIRPQLCQALDLKYPEQKQILDASAHPGEHVQLRLKQQLDEILRHDPGTRLGRDQEDLHQMRVATRRARAILRTIQPASNSTWNPTIRREIGWLASTLGRVRDFDVLLEKLQRETQTLTASEQEAYTSLLNQLASQRAEAHTTMLDALRSPRYLTLLDHLQSSIQHMDIMTLHVALQDLAKKEFDKLEKAVDNLPKAYNDEDLHRLRIRAKRVRYATELAEPCTGKSASQLIRQVRKLQDLLGEHQDTVMIEEQLQTFLRTTQHISSAFTAGLIVERLRRRRVQARRAFPNRWGKVKKRAKATLG